MRTWKFQIVSVLLLLVTSAQAQQKFVILPARLATRIAKQGTWQPTKADIDGIEANLSQVSKLKAENWKSPAIRIDHPETYFRQYIAILRDGKRRIYVNAFCDERITFLLARPPRSGRRWSDLLLASALRSGY